MLWTIDHLIHFKNENENELFKQRWIEVYKI